MTSKAMMAYPAKRAYLDIPRPTPEELALPLEIEVGRRPALVRAIIVSTVGALAVLLLLAALAPLRELALAEGQVIPEGQVTPIQHLEGGIVGKIFVKAGQVVEAGEPLLQMEPTAARADLEQLAARRANLLATQVRLQALLKADEPDFTALAQAPAEVVREQKSQYLRERDALEKVQAVHKARIDQRASEIASAEAELLTVESQISSQRERLAMRETLLKGGLTSRTSMLDAKVMLDQSLARRAQVKGLIDTGRNALQEARNALSDAEASRRLAWSSDLTKASADLAETEQQIARFRDRFDRVVLRSPSRALVHSLTPRVAGDVLKPGEVAVELVPLGNRLVAEVRLRPEDVAYVRQGRPARVKLTAFDSEAFGIIDAVVTAVSPTTFETPKGEPYYKATLSLAKDRVARGGEAHDVLPGMVVHAEIITGERSVLRYLLKPVYRSLDVAFSER